MFWVFVALIVIGVVLMLVSGKKAPGAKEHPAAMQWGSLAVLVGVFGALTDYWSITAVMLLLVVVCGIATAWDKWVAEPRRKAEGAEPGFFAENARGFFPVLLAVFLLRSFVAEPFVIPSSSMRPGLVVGDFILVNKFTYGIRVPVLNNVLMPVNKVEHGDVMVFNFPVDPKKNFIKRVIGLPGDVIEYRDKHLSVNGKRVADTPDGSYEYREPAGSLHADRLVETYNGKSYAILNMADKAPVLLYGVRDFPARDQCQYDENGFICKVPEGKYFMMGDNRDNSDDSRYWGFVDDSLVVGKAFMIWMNVSEPSRIGTLVR